MIGKLKESTQGMARKCRKLPEQEAIAIPVAEEILRGEVAVRIWSWVHLAGRRTKVEAAWWAGPMEERTVQCKSEQPRKWNSQWRRQSPRQSRRARFLISSLLPLSGLPLMPTISDATYSEISLQVNLANVVPFDTEQNREGRQQLTEQAGNWPT